MAACRLVSCVVVVLGMSGRMSDAQPGFGSNSGRTSTSTLYTGNDPVVQLHRGNLTASVAGSDRAWAVVFYASWCGHCQRFAPTWIQVGRDIKPWSGIVQAAALACSHPDNVQLCSDYGVESYPAIKYFPPHGEAGFKGSDYSGSETVAALRGGIVNFLSNLANYPLEWPKLEPLESLSDPLMIRLIHNNKKRIFVVVEDESQTAGDARFIGREVILDMSQYRTIVVRRMLKSAAVNYGVSDFPSLHRVHRDSSLELLPAETGRTGFSDYLRHHFLGLEGVRPTSTPAPALYPATTVLPVLPDGVHSLDLESGLFKSLFHEAARQETLDASELAILQSYVNLVHQLLPVRPETKAWLGRVKQWLDGHSSPMEGEEFVKAIADLQTADAYIPERVVWEGCRGSKPHLRGYPCSLWTIFHSLTVNAYLNTSSELISPKDVLLTMKTFIINFFGCEECAENFQEEAAGLEAEVNSPTEGVLWLWETHNRVNNRLHNDPTEDPRHPKMQFPTTEACPKCHDTQPASPYSQGGWNRPEVLTYLTQFYSADNVKWDSVPYTFTDDEDGGTTDQSPALKPLPAIFVALFLINLFVQHLRYL